MSLWHKRQQSLTPTGHGAQVWHCESLWQILWYFPSLFFLYICYNIHKIFYKTKFLVCVYFRIRFSFNIMACSFVLLQTTLCKCLYLMDMKYSVLWLAHTFLSHSSIAHYLGSSFQFVTIMYTIVIHKSLPEFYVIFIREDSRSKFLDIFEDFCSIAKLISAIQDNCVL